MEEVGEVVEGKTKFLKSMYVYHSVRKPEFVYEFTSCGDDKYQCTECRKYGRKRVITIRENAVVTEQKHPEDDHHENCHPLTEISKTYTFTMTMCDFYKTRPILIEFYICFPD